MLTELDNSPMAPRDAGPDEGARAAERPGGPAAASEPRRRIIAIGGGKGGIGKSMVAANLGVQFAQTGGRVVMVDADLGGANLHTCLGVGAPQSTLTDFIARKVDDLAHVVSPTAIPRLGLISGALDFLGAANPKYTQKLRLLRAIGRLDVDYVIIDLGGGTGFNILDFFLIAHHGVLTVVPEPTSIENAYRFIKAAYYRRLKTVELAWNLKPIVEQALDAPGEQGLKTPADLVRYVEERSPEAGQKLRDELDKFPLKLIVNQVRTEDEHRLGAAICAACRKYFGIEMEHLGSVPYDDAVWRSVRVRRPVVVEAPGSPATLAIQNIAKSLWQDDA